LVIAARSFDDVRVSNLERIRKIKVAKADLAPALDSVIARNALLTDTPIEENTAQLLSDPTVLAAEVEREIQAISNGHDPYTDRLGDTWRSIVLQARPLPFRVYAPKAASKRVPLPLVIAFHGAGGDENVFFNGYGAGILKKVADDEGMIVVTPLTSEIARNPAAFASLLGVVSRNYVIDPARIYLLGHSLGAGVVMELGRQSKGKVAALCCISGGGGSVPDKTLPPLLILSGGLDPLVSSATLAAGVIKLRAGGQNVEIRTFADFGHSLIVGSKLREAVAWLLDHHL